MLTESQVWDVIEFARGLSQRISGAYTPDTTNANLKRLGGTGHLPAYDKLIRVLSEDGNEDVINSFCRAMETFDTLFSKTLNYFCSLPSYDLSYVCINAKGEEFKSKKYLKDEQRVRQFLFSFDYKKYFSNVFRNLLLNGKYFCWFRESESEKAGVPKYALQMLPQDYCKITGSSQLGALFDIDLSFLLSGEVDVDTYAPIFGKYYDELCEGIGQRSYIPSNPLNNRVGSYAFWKQTSQLDGAWCFLYDDSNFKGLSPMAPFLKDTILGAELQKLQRDKSFNEAYNILFGEIGMMKETKQPNATSFEPRLLGELLKLVSDSLDGLTKVAAVPLQNVDIKHYSDSNPNMYSNNVKVTSGLGASASRLIYHDDKMGEAELIAAITNDAGMLQNIYRQFETFLNFVVNQLTTTYKFSFRMCGLNYFFDKEERRNALEFAVDRGIIPNLPTVAAALGYPPHYFEQAVEQGHFGDLNDKLGALISIHTQSGSESLNNKGGRPRLNRTHSDTRSRDKRGTGKRAPRV